MPKLSTSEQAKARVVKLLRSLLNYSDQEWAAGDSDRLAGLLDLRWLEATGRPKLMVKTRLSALVKLVSSDADSQRAKEQIRHDLRLLKDFVKILDDHRLKTQGAEHWHFTLRLWSRSTEQNLVELERLWEQQKTGKSGLEPAIRSAPVALRHNLPARSHTAFVGAQAALENLLSLLDSTHPASLVCIEGSSGVGKTTLALEAGHRCRQVWLEATDAVVPRFGAIIYVSAKPEQFLGNRLTQRLKVESSLQDIFRTILRTLGALEPASLAFEQQIETVRQSLAAQQTLLIVDNLEALEAQSSILAFLSELPPTVKVVITSRIRLGVGTALPLSSFSLENSLALIQHYAQEKAVQISLEQAQTLYHQAGGLPLALAYGMGQLAVCGSNIASANWVSSDEFMQYCFAATVQQLQDQPAYWLLLALALFSTASTAAVQTVAQVAAHDAEIGLALLHRFSLVELRQGYYDLHALTRIYVRAELNMYPDFEQSARERWVAWYLEFLEPYGQQNWRDWQVFAPLEQEWPTLCQVMAWCKQQDRYQEVQQLWQQLKGYTQFYGHWSERLDWLDWLITAARERQDWAMLIDSLYQLSRTLYLFDQPEQTQQAVEFCQQAWELAQAQNSPLQVELTIHQAALCSQQQQLDRALTWLERGTGLLHQFAMASGTATPTETLYQQIDLDYYRAEIYRLRQDYQQAKQLYSTALRQAEAVGWQRATVYIKGWLAAIAIAEGDWQEAEQLLNFVLAQAEQHKDKRCLSLCQSYLALLEKQRQNSAAAHHWSQLAKSEFEQLQMQRQATEMDRLVQ